MGRLRYGVLVCLSLLVALPLPAAAAAPKCFGKPATIVGSGTIPGTSGNDVIVGSAADDTIDGSGGNDRICGRGGQDDIEGGLGDDQLSGGSHEDFIVGDVYLTSGSVTAAGNDKLFGGQGSLDIFATETLIGDNYVSGAGSVNGGGNDFLDGGTDGAVIVGDSQGSGTVVGGGNDIIKRTGSAVGDSVSDGTVTGSGDDRIFVGSFGYTPAVAIGDSKNNSGSGVSANGSSGDDVITFSGTVTAHLVGDHWVDASVAANGAGNDEINGGRAGDVLIGDSATIVPFTTTGTDGGSDVLSGKRGDDELEGGPGDDTLKGGKGTADDCDGQTGTDVGSKCETITSIP